MVLTGLETVFFTSVHVTPVPLNLRFAASRLVLTSPVPFRLTEESRLGTLWHIEGPWVSVIYRHCRIYVSLQGGCQRVPTQYQASPEG